MQHLLLLHGAIGSKDQLQPVAGRLKDNYITHTLNFSGHGGATIAKEDFSIPLFAREVLSYLQQNSITKAHIFGYSMGGYVAMYLAKHHPSFVDKIITLATKFYWDEITAAKEIKKLDAETILQKIPGFAAQLRNRHHPNDWKIVLSKTRDMLVQLGRNNTLQIEDYKSIFAPSLLLLGDRDNMVTVEETMAVQKALAKGKFRTLANTAHPIEHADTEMLASIVTGFMI